MVSVPSTMLSLGTKMPEFALQDLKANTIRSSDFEGEPVLVIFLCNHCPYVRHIIERLSQKISEYQGRGIHVVGINANDTDQYPADAPEKMREFASEHDFSFPYLFDESQEVAKKYRAACTPDFFLFDNSHTLVYRGQFDGSRPGNEIPVTGKDLTRAVNAMLQGGKIPSQQTPSVGCNIKWKPGNKPAYA